MKKILFIINLFLVHSLSAQITLKECIDSGLANQPDIKSAKSEVILANLKSIERKAKYLPEISLAYDYRYNPIIATQIIPLGQFNQIPTDETRPIQFGTNWQQNAGITLYQPILDLPAKNRIQESYLNESLSQIDLKKAEVDLSLEITKTYNRIISLGYQLEEAVSDTLRSYQSFSLVNSKFNEGKVLKTEVNNALINHNSNLTNFKKASASLINEKIYLHYLTNIDLERILEGQFSPIPESFYLYGADQSNISFDSIPDYQRLKAKEKIIFQQIKTDRAKYSPSIGLQGFIGANQFSQTFDPFLANSWFGSSYVGLSLKLPIFSPDQSINGEKQLRTQLLILNSDKEKLQNEKNKDWLQTNVEIERLKTEISILENSMKLQSENLKVYQNRMENGQLAAIELNIQEAELQKLSFQLKQLNEKLSETLIERLYVLGILSYKLETL